jgi:hypothetical protein
MGRNNIWGDINLIFPEFIKNTNSELRSCGIGLGAQQPMNG